MKTTIEQEKVNIKMEEANVSTKEYVVVAGKGSTLTGGHFVQELVRCKDCRWWHPDYKQQKGYCGQANGMTEKQPTWFCADGERKKEDRENAHLGSNE